MVAGTAHATSIGVFFDAAATDCDTQIPENSSFEIYVIAILRGDAAAGGITGAEYRLTGADPAWSTLVTPGPGANLVLGSPIDGVGVNIAWPACQMPPTGMLLLHTISVFSPGVTQPRTLQVQERGASSMHGCAGLFSLPLVTLCDAEFTQLCVREGAAFINRSEPCTVADEPVTWTQVKGLYTN